MKADAEYEEAKAYAKQHGFGDAPEVWKLLVKFHKHMSERERNDR